MTSITYHEGQRVRMTKHYQAKNSFGSVVVEGVLLSDEENDLYLPHAGFVTNHWLDDFDPKNEGWKVEILE